MKRIKISRVFIITMIFFISIFALFSSVSSFSKSGNDEINVINTKISELEEMKRGYESKAIKHSHEAERFQFMEGELQRAKQHWKLADENKKVALKIQKQIDELKIKKVELQKKQANNL
ncbi:MAG: hypothetical protein WCT85_07085 [Parachlamydiales bacterium]|jgi:hypothetical protein